MSGTDKIKHDDHLVVETANSLTPHAEFLQDVFASDEYEQLEKVFLERVQILYNEIKEYKNIDSEDLESYVLEDFAEQIPTVTDVSVAEAVAFKLETDKE